MSVYNSLRRSTDTRPDGEKQAAILEAEGRFEAPKRYAQANVSLAEASQQAIEKVTQTIQDRELPVMYILGKSILTVSSRLQSARTARPFCCQLTSQHRSAELWGA